MFKWKKKEKPKKKNYLYWVNNEGEEINIHHMSDQYIINCINLILRSYTSNSNYTMYSKLSPQWLMEHGRSYINVFSREIDKRMRFRDDVVPGQVIIGRVPK